jgi:hypothetical protein
VLDVNGMLVRNIDCANGYSGGGGNGLPLPYAAPDLGSMITAVNSCSGPVATVGAATSAQTGSNKNCTAPGCAYGAPRPLPNPTSTATSLCLLSTVATGASGSVDCSTGGTNISMPLNWVIYLPGDASGDPGIQPCPRCLGGLCAGGLNNGMSCTADTTTMGGNPGYPTSSDCPPDVLFDIGTLPIAYTLSSSTLTWTGTTATNDVSTSVADQSRVFSGYCRDVALPGGTGGFESPRQKCWENGMAVGPPCGGDTFETCEQRTTGAFGPNGHANMTITAIGNAMSLLGGPAPASLVTLFTVPMLFDGLFDGYTDLPGPGAVALPGTARTCSNAMTCP